MPTPNTGGQLRSSIHDMEIGDYIVWRSDGYVYHMDNQAIVTERPVTGASSLEMAYQNTFWYGVKVAKGLIVADRVIEHSVSWDTLNSRRQIQGIPLTLGDGTQGIMRSLGGGNAYADVNGDKSLADQGFGAWPANNEYDKYIAGMFGGADDVWHWSSNHTWCQDTPINGLTDSGGFASSNIKRIIRGYDNAKKTGYTESNQNVAWAGFRPVFEYKEV
jgi:hypothetical protein